MMSASTVIRTILSLASLVGAGLCLWVVSRPVQSDQENLPSSEAWALTFTDQLVVIDPGHGGHDGGTQGFGALEKDLTLAISQRVAQHLQKKGIPVAMTRQEDIFIDLEERSEIANRKKAAVFLSIHLNADATSAETAGVEIYHSSRKQLGDLARLKRDLGVAPETRLKDTRSEMLAGLIQKRVCAAINSPDRGVRDSSYLVVMNAKCAAVLLECGYLTNEHESKKLQETATQENLAAAISDGVRHYLTATVMNPERGLIFNGLSDAVPAPAVPPVAGVP